MGSTDLAAKKRVLVIDDEPVVREVTVRMLDTLGFTAGAAAEAAEGIDELRRAQQRGAHYQAVILDLGVGRRESAGEILRRLKRIDPTVRVLLSSGSAADPLMEDYRAHGFSARITKPFRMADLQVALEIAFQRLHDSGGTAG